MRVALRTLVWVLFASVAQVVYAQPATTTRTATDANGYTYQYVQGDPLQARVYTLPNGLTVYISVNREEPKFYAAIAVRAGSKHDPSTNTGLAHYLEHMLFKGTNRLGTVNYEAERAHIKLIYELYDQYNQTTDEDQRRRLYAQIDSVSQIAAQYAVANEYDKLVGQMGCEGTNAFTSFEQTVYINNVPSHQLERWVRLEAERFREPVMRLFHTELETVYEEKNISLDDLDDQLSELMLDRLFPNHNYGQQTTIGTIDHLKNPSLTAIEAYFRRYYVPNNMCISLAGDINPDQAIKLIAQHFGTMQRGNVEAYTFTPEPPLQGPYRLSVTGPEAESVSIAYRLPGNSDPDAELFELVDYILSNGYAGLIDLNLNQAQRVQTATSSHWGLNDYGILYLMARPLEGQTLEQAEGLLLEQVEKLRSGNFDPALLQAVIRNFRIQQIRGYQSNNSRAFQMAFAYTGFEDWAKVVARLDRLAQVTPQDIQRVASKYLVMQNAVVGYKRNGERQQVVKVQKPEITPVNINRDTTSRFATELMRVPANEIQPMFLNFSQELKRSTINPNVTFVYKNNPTNPLFSLYYVFDFGTWHDPELAFAINEYLQLLGTDSLTADELKFKMYQLGCSFGVRASADQCYVYLNGIQETYAESVALFEKWLSNLKGNSEALNVLVEKVLKERKDAKLNKRSILFGGLQNYALFGPRNPFNDVIPEQRLRTMNADSLALRLRGLINYPHEVFYYGPATEQNASAVVKRYRPQNQRVQALPPIRRYAYQPQTTNRVLFVHYDMVQAELLWVGIGDSFRVQNQPVINLFNEYFDGSMGGIVFQEIRESQALAYSAWADYANPQRLEFPHLFRAYVGTQADKLPDALNRMNGLLTQFISSDNSLSQARAALRQQIASERILRENVYFTQRSLARLGLREEMRPAIYEGAKRLSMQDIRRFFDNQIKNRKWTLCVIGDRSRIDMEALKRFGPVQEVSLEQIFGY
jgi:predicted Zn-dependent peptidase